MTNVLVVERDASAAEAMVRNLRRQGYIARSVDTGTRALRTYRETDLVLLSLELPDMDGLEVCRSLHSGGDTPLIAVTDLDDELDRVLALKAGADDCVGKTWGFREISARIEAVLRRARPVPGTPGSISLRPLHLNPRTQEVRLHGRVVQVTSKEFELLYALASDPETALSRKDLMTKVWGSNWVSASRTIDTHVSSLRAKLGSSRWIITVRGVGYRMGHVQRAPEGSGS
ncbi:response regulator transcription factor [Streptomyces sp. SP17KL33]|uniref:response regulator transcription factor n=1 Tax=Streptomyces sp. SP17KL33 TaxID=3002534 RepID=UPI002E76BE0C|nr:response regulator transcription factor [Streptomyces sp. SP17KL33]MEE1831327.1 response regulator transcription factor [Streptomyces sp. SP17KL33]